MKKNVGAIDKAVRISLVVVVAALIVTHVVSGVAAIVLGALAAVFLLTSLVSFCPLYLPLGLSTVRK